ncbi:MAG: hypothetical protein CM15mP93_16530 [Thiotrichaceae bacterium]|nr:MAG: hypothetical protein CM15mP93_16530 [Thiotrichaceae bacterium]
MKKQDVVAVKVSAFNFTQNMETIIENIKDINYFELFSLKQDLDPDLEELELKYFQLQAKFHPDKFINSSDSEKEFLYITHH